jgi:hypothetical protein
MLHTEISKLLDVQKRINMLEAQKQFIQTKKNTINKMSERKERVRSFKPDHFLKC